MNTRRYPRLQAEHPMYVEVLSGHTYEGFSRTRVIGLGGCSFFSPEGLGYLSLMKLSISVAGRILVADGRVAYELRNEDGRYEVGVEFLRLSLDDRRHIAGLFPPGDQRLGDAPEM